MNIVKKHQEPIVNERLQEWRDGKRNEPDDLLDVFISLKDANGQPLLSDEEIKAQTTVNNLLRGCMGVGLGYAIVVMLLARLLQGFSWSLPPNVDKIDFTEDQIYLKKTIPLLAQAKPRLPASVYPI
ncbi:hypothetical protein ACE6H2_024362 [Prunus campanulata]